MLGKRALQTGVQVAQDVLAGENVKTATNKGAKQALVSSLLSSGLGVSTDLGVVNFMWRGCPFR